MKISEELCSGCGLCLPYCPVGAISLKENKAYVNLNICVECGTCKRFAPCPNNAIIYEELKWPRTLTQYLSDPTITKKETGVAGRGTEECKTNDVTGRFCKGEIGICIEPGRPGVGTTFRDVEKITMKLAKVGVEFEEKNPIAYLMKDKITGKLKEDILDERVLSCVIEFRVKVEKFPEVIKALKEIEEEVETVFSVGIISRLEEDGKIPILQMLESLGVEVRPNAKINLGLGKPLVEC